MVSRTRLKSILTGLALYTLAALLIGYFYINAYSGKYGLNAQAALDQESVSLTAELVHLKAQRKIWEHRTALLRTDRIDPDMLDEQARKQLNFAHERDLVLLLRDSASR